MGRRRRSPSPRAGSAPSVTWRTCATGTRAPRRPTSGTRPSFRGCTTRTSTSSAPPRTCCTWTCRPPPCRGPPVCSPDDRLRGLSRAIGLFHAAGLTSVCDALIAPGDVALLHRARTEGLLTLRVGMLLSIDHYAKARELGVGSGFGDDMLRFVGV